MTSVLEHQELQFHELCQEYAKVASTLGLPTVTPPFSAIENIKCLVTKNNAFGIEWYCFVKYFNLQGVSQRLSLVTCHKFNTD